MSIVSGNLIALATGGVLVSFDIPAAPSITSVTDNGDEDSIDVVVAGTGAMQLYYRVKYTTTWTTGQTRSGSGTITQTGLTAGVWYELYITANVSGSMSPPSKISIILIVSSSDTTIETALHAILIADETINGIISGRVYPNIVPQKTDYPAVTYQQISGPRDNVMDGATGLVDTRYQINCWAETYAAAKELSEAVRKELSGFSGTVNTREIAVIFLEDEGDIPTIRPGVETLYRFGKRLDFTIWYQETAN